MGDEVKAVTALTDDELYAEWDGLMRADAEGYLTAEGDRRIAELEREMENRPQTHREASP